MTATIYQLNDISCFRREIHSYSSARPRAFFAKEILYSGTFSVGKLICEN